MNVASPTGFPERNYQRNITWRILVWLIEKRFKTRPFLPPLTHTLWPKIGKKAVLTERKDHLENKLDSGHLDCIYSTYYGYPFHESDELKVRK